MLTVASNRPQCRIATKIARVSAIFWELDSPIQGEAQQLGVLKTTGEASAFATLPFTNNNEAPNPVGDASVVSVASALPLL